MLANRRVDTAPERALRSHLHGTGLRFRKDFRIKLDDVSVRADVAFPAAKLAVFVDGCFWHGCPDHRTWPVSNAGWWRRKLDRNRERDRDTDQRLKDAGWTVIRVWEHQGAEEAVEAIDVAVRGGRRAEGLPPEGVGNPSSLR